MARQFGKRTPEPQTDESAGAQPAASDQSDTGASGYSSSVTGASGGLRLEASEELPWKGQPDETACDLALDHLVSKLPEKLAVDGRTHAETLLAASAAIAGFVAQRALFSQLEETGDAETRSQISVMGMSDGRGFFLGEPLNQTLVAQSAGGAQTRLWSLVVAAAVSCGLAVSRLPDVDDMFVHVTGTLGDRDEGMPSVPERHHPQMPPQQLLARVWPLAVMCFTGKFPGEAREFGEAGMATRPAIAARAASSFIAMLKDELDMALALTIVMETAIYASKLDPATIEQPAAA